MVPRIYFYDDEKQAGVEEGLRQGAGAGPVWCDDDDESCSW